MIGLYRMFSLAAYWLLYPYARWQASRGHRKWQDRLGLTRLSRTDIWMHAASVGEVKIIATLVQYLLDSRPTLRIHVTSMTDQGVRTAKDVLKRRATVSFFPIDCTPVTRRTLTALSPRIIVVAETEIWPNLILEAKRSDIPLALVNGRMSEKSFGKYKFARGSVRSLLSVYDRLLLKSEADRDRVAYFVTDPERLEIAGDMKFDAPLQEKSRARIRLIREHLGVAENQFLLVAGSTRPGEEALLAAAYRNVRAFFPRFRMVLAPRHLDRLNEVFTLLTDEGISYRSYSGEGTAPASAKPADSDVIVVDRMGLLNDLYLAADLAFVGGTLVNLGGHNLLEPVWVRTPVVFGPSVDNVRDAAEYIKRHNYGMEVDSIDSLQKVMNEMMTGERAFETKTDTDDLTSATAIACTYVLERLNNA